MFILSWLSLLVSILAVATGFAMLVIPGLGSLFIILSIASLVLPLISKVSRISYEKKGKVLEILAIVIGGFSFTFLITLFTPFPFYVEYLGWVVSGLIYKGIK